MAMDPAAISATPPTTISRVELTAPDNPAASAKGTVRPSAMPMTTSRTNRPAVKCFSTCGVIGMLRSNLRMRFQIFLSLPHDLALAVVREFGGRIFERKPQGPANFDAHFGSDVIDASRLVAQQIETDNLENALPIAPGAHVDVADIGEPADQGGG